MEKADNERERKEEEQTHSLVEQRSSKKDPTKIKNKTEKAKN
jgi:hypothetical protein